VALESIGPEPDGLVFDPTFESWKPISATDRGDNNTFRFILGNDVAVKAAQTGNISPWPDGARFAKIAWQQELAPDGLVHPGNFVQVELMLKDARLYQGTEGWGWGRWRGLDLKPYGADARFVNECTNCHRPMRGNDYVYSLPITAAKLDRDEVVNHRAAALPASLPYQRSGGARSPCTSIQIRRRRQRSMAMMMPCEACKPVGSLRWVGRRARLIRQEPCSRSLPGYNATTRTGSAHASQTRHKPWSSCNWQPQEGQAATVASQVQGFSKIPPAPARQPNGRPSS
jgi:hypothetical protein